MISLNTESRMPGNVLGYLLVSRIILSVILVIIGIVFISLGTLHGTTTSGGVTTPTSISGSIPGVIAIFFGILVPLSSILWYFTFSFAVTNNSITINSGILFRQSRTIDFNKIQSIDNTKGPIQMMFGLTQVNIWTASEDQLVVTNTRYGTRTTARPDGMLYLSKEDAEQLKSALSQGGAVQDVRIVSQAPTQSPAQSQEPVQQ